MVTRRTLLTALMGSISAIALSGCGQWRRFFQPEVSRTAIDIHAHFFNGRDVPIVGFLQQTQLRDAHAPVDPQMRSDAFLKLLKAILLAKTPTAAEELATLENGAAPMSPAAVEAQDEAKVAEALERFSRSAGQSTAGLRTSRSAEEAILDRIAAEVGATPMRKGLQTQRAQTTSLASRIYAKDTSTEAKSLTAGQEREYVHRSSLMQTIRWAGLLTRSRLDILAELDRLYGQEGGIRIFSPSLVDFTAWFFTEESVTPVEDQIEVVARIAQVYEGALILPFAPFCPLRAALEREDDPDIDPLRNVKHAVMERGFLGVKLYPPMAFRPVGNDSDLSWVPRKPVKGGAALDRELDDLFVWCVENEVAIKAHATNSIAAGPDTGRFADPAGWQVLMRDKRFSDLRLNLAHFGGFDETYTTRAFTSGGNWEETLVEMVEEFPNVYFDLGYWNEVAEGDAASQERVLTLTSDLLERHPEMVNRMMYGSDWSMIGKEPSHPEYLAKILGVLEQLSLTDTQTQRVMGGNAARYLGLDHPGPPRGRLQKVYADHPVYKSVFT